MNFAKAALGVLVLAASVARGETVVNQGSADTTLLSATVVSATLSSTLDVRNCALLGEAYGAKSYDCKAALAAATGAVVIAERVVLQVGFDPVGREYILNGAGETPLVVVTTVTREGAFDRAANLGFYYDHGGYNFTYEKAQLAELGRTELKDGTRGVIHRFVTPFTATGSGNAGLIRAVCIKPFVDFLTDGTRYRNWDLAPWSGQGQDHCLIQGYEPYMPDRTSIDRRAELLRE